MTPEPTTNGPDNDRLSSCCSADIEPRKEGHEARLFCRKCSMECVSKSTQAFANRFYERKMKRIQERHDDVKRRLNREVSQHQKMAVIQSVNGSWTIPKGLLSDCCRAAMDIYFHVIDNETFGSYRCQCCRQYCDYVRSNDPRGPVFPSNAHDEMAHG